MSVWLPNWPIERLKLASPEAETASPLALTEPVDGLLRLAAVNTAAAALGLAPGQKLSDARAMCPALAVVEADRAAERRDLESLAAWCQRYTPATAIDTSHGAWPDSLWLDITGCDHLVGGEARLAEDLRARLARRGLRCQTGIADTFGAAWAVAHGDQAVSVVPSGEQAEAIKSFLINRLRVDPDTIIELRRLGLRTVRDLQALHRGEVAKRFGEGLLMRLDQAQGEAEEAIRFARPATPWFERLAFAEPIAAPDDLARALERLARTMARRLSATRCGARRFEAAFHRADGEVAVIGVGLSLMSRDAERIAELLKARLDQVDPGFGIDLVTLAAARIGTLAPAQGDLAVGACAPDTGQLAPALDRLTNRLGLRALWRTAPFPSHLPERAVRRLAPLAERNGQTWPAHRPRPVRLLQKPEAIEAMAPVPDDPPVQFRWRGLLHRVRLADGPERIAYEWWRQHRPEDRSETDMVRDYYRVEDEAGTRFWIYRAGLYAPAHPARWYLHGLFG
jgi:protein ImuB